MCFIVIFKDVECNFKAVDISVCQHTVLVVICFAVDAFTLFVNHLVAVIPEIAFHVFFCIGRNGLCVVH